MKAELTPLERRALVLSGELADLVSEICWDGGDPEVAAQDWGELAAAIHVIQARIAGQVAARAHPQLFRLLGSPLAQRRGPDA